MIILLTAMSTLFINKLKVDTKNILVANYNTLDYSRKMLIALDEGIYIPGNIEIFRENLRKQERNITEIGEKELTENLALHFTKLVDSPANSML
jgi:hypothetical protein